MVSSFKHAEGTSLKKDLVVAAVAVVIVVAVAFALSAMRPDLPLTPSEPFRPGAKKAEGGKAVARERAVMHVNGEPITEREFNLFVMSAPEEARQFYASPQGRRALADELIKMKVLEQEGERLGVPDDPAMRAQLAMVRAQLTAGRTLERLGEERVEPELRAAYEKEKGNAIALRHIVFAYQGGAMPARGGKQPLSSADALAKAQQTLAQLRAGADFAQLARTESDDEQSAANGGMLGPARPEGLPPEIGSVVSKLKPGQVSEPLKTQFGIHLFKVEQPSLEDLRPMLMQRVRQQVAMREVERLQQKAKVEYDKAFFPPGLPEPQRSTPAPKPAG
jgi:peptidyl-prolyl cis-trans isomerase C